jgi:hypothetical protein
MATVQTEELRTSEIKHRRQTLVQIILPLALVLLLIIGLLAAALLWLLPRRPQVSILADVMFTVLMLCPAVLCVLPITIGLVSAVFAMNRAHDSAARPLRRLEALSVRLTQRAESTADTINRKTIETSARMGGVYKVLGVLEDNEDNEDDE